VTYHGKPFPGQVGLAEVKQMKNAHPFERLSQPLQIKNVTFRNRITKTPQQMNLPEFETGYVTDEVVGFYVALARGGMGALVVEQCPVEPDGSRDGSICAYDDAMIPGLTRLADAAHEQGCPIIVQINHLGPHAHMPLPPRHAGFQPAAPSELDREMTNLLFPGMPDRKPRSLTIPEIKTVISNYAKAAERVKRAGFDGVELHGDHMYLINSFLSRVWNRRDDEYGMGSIENRARFCAEIIRACREKIGDEYLLGVKLNGAEYGHPLGTTSQECQQIARILEAEGADYFTIVADGYGVYSRMAIPDQVFYPEPPKPLDPLLQGMSWRSGMCIPLVEAVKKAVSVPVFGAGGMDAPHGEEMIRKGQADGIAIGRVVLADHYYPKKVFEGKEDEVRPCVHCITCESRMVEYVPVRCTVNAALGRGFEGENFAPAARSKNVVVVGGGPAGMEAARVMALRGHAVTLYEKEPQLGGSVNVAALIKGTEVYPLPEFVQYFERQMAKRGVTVKLGQEFSPAMAEALKPDVVVIATGGLPNTPEIPGITGEKVLSSAELKRRAGSALRFTGTRTVERLTKMWLPVGKKVAVIGGGIQGCEIAEFLVKRGRTVSIVEPGDRLGEGIPLLQWVLLEPWLRKKGVDILTRAACEEVNDRGLVVTDSDGRRQTIEADSILVAMPLKSDSSLYEALVGTVPEVYRIGDCHQPGLIIDAMGTGFEVGRTV
jgi:2,4-dienoyl-CoA reductase (NADPH2)